ncbi:OLC1v1002726C1 [Oldenlandia corymbosa var. corymbosa]|uniref:OLC1v1002726C1 n=1 Tax=Oldenlandia corymbosa var. corymbosa TaxID=529605 RepID=A0AAV1DB69_OLDCO|nr:OLC1v1002726C1 [Oldenlandia corymbosa var. corymbosa]
MVDAHGGSPECKPKYLFVKVSEKYCIAWNHREVESLGVIKDERTKEDDENVKEIDDDLKKIMKYPKLIKWSDVMRSSAAPKKKKKRIGGPTVAVHTFGDPLAIEFPLLEEFAAQLNETDNVRLDAIEEVNMAATKYGAYKVAVAGLKRLNRDRPIKAKWFKYFLKENPKKAMHEALVNVLTKLSIEQLPLWEPLCGALAKMGTPEKITTFPSDLATVSSKDPSEEEPILEVPDEYMGIELENADDEASEEDVADTCHSGAQKNTEETSRSLPKDNSFGQDVV